MAKMNQWIDEYKQRKKKKDEDIKAKEAKKQKLIEEPREFFGYYVDPRDTKFQVFQEYSLVNCLQTPCFVGVHKYVPADLNNKRHYLLLRWGLILSGNMQAFVMLLTVHCRVSYLDDLYQNFVFHTHFDTTSTWLCVQEMVEEKERQEKAKAKEIKKEKRKEKLTARLQAMAKESKSSSWLFPVFLISDNLTKAI